MTKYIHSVKAEKFSSNRKFSSHKPTHAQIWGLPPTWGMCHDLLGNEIMINVFQQVTKGEKVTQSKESI
jgi:hypothetical protein